MTCAADLVDRLAILEVDETELRICTEVQRTHNDKQYLSGEPNTSHQPVPLWRLSTTTIRRVCRDSCHHVMKATSHTVHAGRTGRATILAKSRSRYYRVQEIPGPLQLICRKVGANSCGRRSGREWERARLKKKWQKIETTTFMIKAPSRSQIIHSLYLSPYHQAEPCRILFYKRPYHLALS